MAMSLGGTIAFFACVDVSGLQGGTRADGGVGPTGEGGPASDGPAGGADGNVESGPGSASDVRCTAGGTTITCAGSTARCCIDGSTPSCVPYTTSCNGAELDCDDLSDCKRQLPDAAVELACCLRVESGKTQANCIRFDRCGGAGQEELCDGTGGSQSCGGQACNANASLLSGYKKCP
jgi:hypothetical protein